MSEATPLIVPLPVEALVVNEAIRLGGGAWVRVEMEYQNVGWAGSAEPLPQNASPGFTSQGRVGPDQAVTASAFYEGVYLKWRLPDALTHGVQDGSTGATTYLPIPNRWLVVRTDGSGATPASWIVESDYTWPDGRKSPASASEVGSHYLAEPEEGQPPATLRIGRNVRLADGAAWSEPATRLGLTAMAPGNPGFTAFQPACNNVLSLIDPLRGQPAATFSYLVVGWHSHADDDALAALLQTMDLGAALEELDWTLPEGTDLTTASPTWTLYAGYATGVQWRDDGGITPGPPSGAVSIAVADSAVDALTVLVDQQAQEAGIEVEAELFEAFQFNLLADLDSADGYQRLGRRVHDAGFQRTDGGYGWEIVDAAGATESPDATELAKEDAWLAELNAAQAELDDARRTLEGLQLRLYDTWWKYVYGSWRGMPEDAGDLTLDAIAAELDPNVEGSLAARVAAQQAVVNALIADNGIPTGESTDLGTEIAAYAASQGLPDSRELKRYGLPRFALPTDPVVLLTGVEAAAISGDEGTLTCRLPKQCVTALTVNGETSTAAAAALPDLSGVTGAPWTVDLADTLVRELYLLDPASATALAAELGVAQEEVEAAQSDPAALTGIAPTGTGEAWGGDDPAGAPRNPWRPLYLFWEVEYYPIAYGDAESPNWTFDGTGYAWTGEGAAAEPITLSGRILLTSAAADNLQARIEEYLAASPGGEQDEDLQELVELVESTDAWDLLSQALDGFNDQLLQRMNGATLSPDVLLPGLDSALPDLIGDGTSRAVELGADRFQPWRSGQFYFRTLTLVDEWGQALSLVTSQNLEHLRLYLPGGGSYQERTGDDAPLRITGVTKPEKTVLSSTGIDFVQLQPRLLQGGRLRLLLHDAGDDGQVMDLAAGVNPVCGWVLPNHLDGGLSAYDPDGAALGEMTVGVSEDDESVVCWTPAPGSAYESLDALAEALPHFGPFLEELAAQGPDAFQAFLSAIDETLWTTAPLGASFDSSLAVLVGRPLAFVRASVRYELDGPALTDPSWEYTLSPAEPAFTRYVFPVELGNVAELEDGLIGYFRDGDGFQVFNVVQQANVAGSDYLKPIGEDGNYLRLPFDGKTAEYVCLLLDPRASVHATSMVVPTAEVSLPGDFVTEALSAMAVSFRMGPVLTDRVVEAGEGDAAGAATVQVPLPAQQTGTWTWVQNESGAWTVYAVGSPDAGAHLSPEPPVLRRGLLQLTGAALD